MFIREFAFQREAVRELIEKVDQNLYVHSKDMLFTAPVASGKTVMAGTFMDGFYQENPEYAFVWLTPGIGNLEEQSKAKIESMGLSVKSLSLDDLLVQRELQAGDALFVNWELLNPDNRAMIGGENISLQDVMNNSSVQVIVLIDEAHHSAGTERSQEKIAIFNPELSIHITATPSQEFSQEFQRVEVDIRDVIEMGLIKKQVIVNKDLESLNQLDILSKAKEKMNELKEAFSGVERSLDVPPLCLIQIANDTSMTSDTRTQEESERIKAMLLSLDIPEEKIAIKLATKTVNYTNIDTSDVEYLIMKQAVATGWDCPRAHVLVRFRDVRTLTFDIQTIGRILRTTEAKHYQNELLDSAYMFTEFDTFQIEGDFESRGRVISSKNLISLKSGAKEIMQTIKFPMQKTTQSTNIEISTEELNELLVRYIDITGFIVNDTRLVNHMARGSIQSDSLTEDLGLEQHTLIKSNDELKSDFLGALSRVYSKYTLQRLVYRILRKKMPDDSSDTDIHKMYLSNCDRINLQIREAIETLEQAATTHDTSHFDYHIIKEVYYPETVEPSERYPYEAKPDLSVEFTQSVSEEPFAQVLDNHAKVKYWFKNLEYGSHFSIAYTYQKEGESFIGLFFPDYIVLTDDKRVLIVDVKASTSGSDYPYVAEKYNASQTFLELHQNDFEFEGEKYAPMVTMAKKIGESDTFITCVADSYNEDFHHNASWVDFSSLLDES